MAITNDIVTPAVPAQSKMHRFQVGDKMQLISDPSKEGVIESFANEPRTYLDIDFGDGNLETLTEDEVRRVG